MFNFFKKKKKEKRRPPLVDIEQQELHPGDKVTSLRYDLGECVIIEEEEGIYYQSKADGRKVHWTRMIDAVTQYQKVKKVTDQ